MYISLIETICVALSSSMLVAIFILGDKIYHAIDTALIELNQKSVMLEAEKEKLEIEKKRLKENIKNIESRHMMCEEDIDLQKENNRLKVRCDMLEEQILKGLEKNLNKNLTDDLNYSYVLYK
jgi:predicted nuclease with TOPRIM domain